MKELKILAVVVFFTLVTYWGVEPFAHSQMHKHVEGHDFVYDGKSDLDVINSKVESLKKSIEDTKEAAKAAETNVNSSDKEVAKKAKETIEASKKGIASAEEEIKTLQGAKTKEVKDFWAHVNKIAALKGDKEAGKAAVGACVSCHGIKAAGNKAPMDALASSAAYGVNPPDLSNAGAIYDAKYLAAFILDPTKGGHTKKSAMPAGMGGDDQNIANIIAYLKSIAPKEITPKEAYASACGRCHANRYGKWTQIGDVIKTKSNIKTGNDVALTKFKMDVAKYQDKLADYMGKLPPDLSIISRARGEHYLKTFVEDPQAVLVGTAMPRVGLTKEGFEKVHAYLEETGDPSAKLRAKVGPWVIGFFVIFTLLAFGWYKSQWKGLK